MVNQVFHNFYSSPADTSEDTESEIELNNASPDISPTCFPDLRSKNQTEKTGVPFRKIFSTPFRLPEKESKSIKQLLHEIAGERLVCFSLKQIKTFTWNFSVKIGEGAHGSSYKGLMPNDVYVAVKLLHRHSLQDYKEEFMAEVSILSRFHHRNIVRLFGYCVQGGVIALVYEYMPNGSLDKYLFNNHNSLDSETLQNIAIGIAKGISFLQEECPEVIIHLDIKPHNILLGSNFSPKLVDVGSVFQYEKDEGDVIHLLHGVGTYRYMAPSYLRHGHLICKSDVYSFGMVLFDILGRPKPFGGNQDYESFPQQVWDKIKLGNLEYLKEQTGRMSMAALWCCQNNPDGRPSMSTVVSILKGETEVIMLPPCPGT